MVFKPFRLHCRRASFLSVSRLGCVTAFCFLFLKGFVGNVSPVFCLRFRSGIHFTTRFIFVFVPARLRDGCSPATLF